MKCGVSGHAKKFAADSSTFYLKENDHRAFIHPSFKADHITDEKITALLVGKYTVKELESLIAAFQVPMFSSDGNTMISATAPTKSSDPSIEVTTADSLVLQASFDLDSPKFTMEETGIFSSTPQLSFDVDPEVNDHFFQALEGAGSADLIAILREFQDRFVSLKTKWSQTFIEVDTSHAIIVKDLKTIRDRLASLKRQVINVSDTTSTKETILSSQLEEVSSSLRSLSHSCLNFQQDHSTRFESLQLQQDEQAFQLQTIQSTTTTLDSKLATMEKYLKEFDKRFTIIFPIIKEFRQSTAKPDTSTSDSLHFKLQDLSEKVAALEQSAWQHIHITSSPTSVTQSVTMDSDIKDIRHQMKILQHRIVGGGMKIGSKVFQSFEDVQVWVKSELPTRRYGLFVDAVSILDFFSCLGHIDAENQVSTLHNANQAGCTSIYESHVTTSVQNIFPNIFGKGDSHQYLPAIRHPDKWDDGTDGLVYQITRGMTDVETQLSSAIDSVLEHYPEARTIASQCLFKAKSFVIDLCTFMSKDYFKWMAWGHSKQDAWNMTSLCIRRVFEEIHSERVVARDIYDPNDLEFTTTKMLWATWKAHNVMEQYLKHHFYEHPSISAVLARHLADNNVKPSATPAAQFSALDKTVKSLSSRVDKLEDKKKNKNDQSS